MQRWRVWWLLVALGGCDDGGGVDTPVDATRGAVDGAADQGATFDGGTTDAMRADAMPVDGTPGDARMDGGRPDANVVDAAPPGDAGPLPDAGPAGVVYRGDAPVYEPGPLATRVIEVPGAPVPLLIHVPEGDGPFAVVVFQHGFILANAWYGDVLTHLASHGYVVVAPQMYPADGLPFGKPTAAEEATAARGLLDWLDANLAQHAPVRLAHLGLAGHSRGGKVIWLMLAEDPGLAQGVVGIDPVDGRGGPLGMEARVLDGPFEQTAPSLIIGTGLGPMQMFGQACAPEGDNHVDFYAAVPPPAFHVVATTHGHNDMLGPGLDACGFICGVCAAGPDPAGMRRLVAGQLTAFFRTTLQGDANAWQVLGDVEAAPVPIEADGS